MADKCCSCTCPSHTLFQSASSTEIMPSKSTLDELKDMTISKSRAAITNRLERLETEINMLIMLSTKQDRPLERAERPQTSVTPRQRKETSRAQSPLEDKNETSFMHECIPEKEQQTEKELPKKDTAINASIITKQSSDKGSRQSKKKKVEVLTTQPSLKEIKQKKKDAKGDKKMKSLQKQPSRHNTTHRGTDAQPKVSAPSAETVCKKDNRSKSASARCLYGIESINTIDACSHLKCTNTSETHLSSSSRTRQPCEPRVKELCNLVVDLKKHKDMAASLAQEWKGKCTDLQATQQTENESDLQQRFMNVFFRTELNHRKLMERVQAQSEAMWDDAEASNRHELNEVKTSLELQRNRNEELLSVCDELRNELVSAGERLQDISVHSDVKLDYIVAEQLKAEPSSIQNVDVFKQQIQEHLSEIEDLRLTCAKNAEWACEESSLKSKLLKKNRFLQEKVTRNYHREQKQQDQINILRHALKKVGKNVPKVKSLLTALKKYDLETGNEATLPDNFHYVPEDVKAQHLITELNTIIQAQGNRIQELVDMTSSLVNDCDLPIQSAPQGQVMRLNNMEGTEQKDRYEMLVLNIQDLRESVNNYRNKLEAECQSKAILQNEVVSLTTLLEESKLNLANKEKDLEELKQNLATKMKEISALNKNLKAVKVEKDRLNEEIKGLRKEHDEQKFISEQLHEDVIRQEVIINNFEKQSNLQRHEQILQRVAIVKEREQAMRAAQFATQKLVDTMDEFRHESESQSKVRTVLTKLLHEKDEQLRAVIDKVSFLIVDTGKLCSSSRLAMNNRNCDIHVLRELWNNEPEIDSETMSSDAHCDSMPYVFKIQSSESLETLQSEKYDSNNSMDSFEYEDDYPGSDDHHSSLSEYTTPPLHMLHDIAEEAEGDEEDPESIVPPT